MFEIPQSVFDTYNEAVNAMIDTNFGIPCLLRYPATLIKCTNCNFNSMTGKSSNIYNGTGPIPFTDGFCPYCNGAGSTDNEHTELIKLRCYFTPKHWIKLGMDIKVPDGAIQTIGHIADLPKCRQCNFMTANSSQTALGDYRYRLWGEPVYHGFQNKNFFIAFWERVR